MSLIPEVSGPSPECPHPERWSCEDGYSSESETVEFLEALVRLMKPKVIVETGSYLGFATYHLARPQIGTVFTAELNLEYLKEALNRCCGFDNVKGYCLGGDHLIENMKLPIDLAFLDSGVDESRVNEMKALKGKLSPGAIVLVHDTNTVEHLGHRLRIFAAAEELGYGRIQFNTPRGLTMMQERF